MSDSNVSDVFGQLNRQNRALATLDSAARARVAPMVNVAFGPLKPYLAAVFGNNPMASAVEVVGRDDVQAAIDKAVAQAVGHVETQIATAASAGHALGQQSAKAQLKLLGYDLDGSPDATQGPYLEAVLARLQEAAKQLKADIELRIHTVVTALPTPVTYHEDPVNGVVNVPMAKAAAAGQAAANALDGAVHDFSFRGQLAVSSAAQRSYADASSATYGMAETQFDLQMGKMWVANFANGHVPCPVCAALSGQVVAWDAQFVVPKGIEHKGFGPLDGPPAHPNCQCKLVPVPLEPETVPAPAPEPTEQQTAAAEPESPAEPREEPSLAEAATVSPELAALPQYFSASDVRGMKSSSFVRMLIALLVALISMIRRKRNG